METLGFWLVVYDIDHGATWQTTNSFQGTLPAEQMEQSYLTIRLGVSSD